MSLSALPHVVRDELPASILNGQTSITWEELAEVQKQKLWDRYNSALLPAYQKNKLGVVVFQVEYNGVNAVRQEVHYPSLVFIFSRFETSLISKH